MGGGGVSEEVVSRSSFIGEKTTKSLSRLKKLVPGGGARAKRASRKKSSKDVGPVSGEGRGLERSKKSREQTKQLEKKGWGN